ncbi:biotin--[acetyl-CoA-carboxylase] ligase [Roseibacterium sp. SDUM158016]|uniref:biotin--[acetyl-CoA-carboxylase] ligase n=1 Tax=Roseicyclus sediminis TaxID=2980997 RepID=UPI0021D2CEDB|nr:biotin--[acetyl-CoA-carboxylase] ligase [Roseibacterium sp. SDUM158016]MCU4654589.1 biotin--[acetyl-CoA-carboxylase] ligase [Roseibacterium sp. SDUM158016]
MPGAVADWPEGVGRRVLTETDSTMAEAARRAAETAGPEWTLALRQTAARGRRGRTWSMPEGNFAASLLMRPKGTAAEAALRSFVASLALSDALLDAGAAEDDIALKWPNDVLFRGGKIAGILLESAGDGRGGVAQLVVGIGVNLAAAPEVSALEPGAVTPVSFRGETGIAIAPEAFLGLLAPAFARHEAHLATYGFAPIRTAWLSHAARLGETIIARLPGEEITGTFTDVDAAGNLVMATPEGRRTIAAAEIFF